MPADVYLAVLYRSIQSLMQSPYSKSSTIRTSLFPLSVFTIIHSLDLYALIEALLGEQFLGQIQRYEYIQHNNKYISPPFNREQNLDNSFIDDIKKG